MITMLTHYSFLALVLLYVHNISILEAFKGGFSVEIFHRDSPKSPFYNLTETRFQRIANSMHRSINRANHFNQNFVTKDTIEATIKPIHGEYLVSYSIGTPPLQQFGIVDTGSELIWLQCRPCKNCYRQTIPIFDPLISNTYKNLPCSSSKECQLRGSTCSSNKKCEYNIKYGDGSHSHGHISFETLTLASTNGVPIKFPKIMIGCGHDSAGKFKAEGSGIVGLGGGIASLTTQLDSFIHGKFSYCLTILFSSRPSSPSKLNFGDAALVSGQGTVSTPLFLVNKIFYYLKLEAFSVGNKRIKFGRSFFKFFGGGGNILIDSGTILTLLPDNVYSELESTVAATINLQRVKDPAKLLSLCYKTTFGLLNAPEITAHFKGANVKLSATHTFVEVTKNVVCFAFRSSNSAIFGNLAQQNLLIGYDLKNKIVSFKPTNCAEK